jgi:DNA-binding PadR family transcriptional regulator
MDAAAGAGLIMPSKNEAPPGGDPGTGQGQDYSQYNSSAAGLSSTNEIRQAIEGRSGEVRMDCPFPDCTGSQTNTLSANADTGKWYCYRCERSGNIYGSNGSGGKLSKPEWIWQNSEPCHEHPYLAKKGVNAYGLRLDKHGNLVVPYSKNGNASTLQFIKPSGDKLFLKGHEAKGAYFQVGAGGGDTIYICEGYATGASIHEATSSLVFIVGFAGNLKPAAENIVRLHPGKQIVFCADNDKHGKGRQKAGEAARAVGGKVCMPEKAGFDFNDLHQQHGLEAVREAIEQTAEAVGVGADQEPEESEAEKRAWAYARQLIPRTPYPWEILPEEITESLKKLARSCATAAAPLPGFACAMIGAAVGRKVNISPKIAWDEPLIFWAIDVKATGEGKTPAMRGLAGVFFHVQAKAQELADQEQAEWEALPKKERGAAPPRARGYYLTDMTLEGLRAEMKDHPTGGIIAILNEASVLINTQNQYKQRGTDRESLLKLHDGDDARVSRVAGSLLIRDARFQAMGGIQPSIFKKVFGGDDGQYLADGTIFRGLYTYDQVMHHPLTLEAWDSAHREAWENTLKTAMQWADNAEQPHTMRLDGEAQDLFLSWRNDLDRKKTSLPPGIRGFLPKTYGHALRLAAAIDLMHQFNAGDRPRQLLDKAGMERGIKAAMFYLGQAVDAIRLILGDELTVDPVKARILEALQDRGEMTATDINNDVFQRNQSADKIQAALNELVEAGQVTATTEPTGGRVKTKYAMNEKNELNEKRESDARADELNSLNSLNSYGGENENGDDEVII